MMQSIRSRRKSNEIRQFQNIRRITPTDKKSGGKRQACISGGGIKLTNGLGVNKETMSTRYVDRRAKFLNGKILPGKDENTRI